ncbi:hypothetical protein [Rubrivivax gelatinosus]|uniref:hypothetical protein n=1 Tax=Rubrivivax gelatinosus TaxID=28068 RepID=UPI0005C1D584|nr:hypothetical protein [Rubrivivax gelatinosus]MBG6083145.1 hypothetical protein [Rubrivivax gelatinosus]
MTHSIEVFQELFLRTNSADVSIRESLLAQAVAPWRHDTEHEQAARDRSLSSRDQIFFVRDEGAGHKAATLVLSADDRGYRVANVVPATPGRLETSEYNAILRDFFESVASPAAAAGGFHVELTGNRQAPEDWTSPEAAAALRTFSECANKSTGSSHPMDQKRWFAFIILAHRSSSRVDTSHLKRWLIEAEGWPAEIAQELAIEFEFGLGLLSEYNPTSI